MLQNKQTVLTKVGTIFLLIYALLVQQPQTGISFYSNPNIVGNVSSDIKLTQIYAYNKPGKMRAAVENPVKKPTFTSSPAPKVAYMTISKTEGNLEAINLIAKYASQNNLNSEVMIKIAQCESGFDANATNGQYAGIYQFHPSTWQSNRRAMGEDDNTSLRFDLEESVKTAAFKMSRDGYGAWPECYSKTLALN